VSEDNARRRLYDILEAPINAREKDPIEEKLETESSGDLSLLLHEACPSANP